MDNAAANHDDVPVPVSGYIESKLIAVVSKIGTDCSNQCTSTMGDQVSERGSLYRVLRVMRSWCK